MDKDTALKIKFEGQSHQIDANTLINFLVHYTSVVAAANDLYGNGDKEVSVKINAIEKGSFVIDLSIAAKNFLADIFCKDNVAYLAGLATVVEGAILLYKELKGKPAKPDIEINVNNINLDMRRTIVEVYNQPIIREAVSKSFETVEKDSSVEGVTFLSGTGGQVKSARDEFAEMIYDDFDKEVDIPDQRTVFDEDANLVITKLSFEKGASWEFNYRGFRIKMSVKDNALMQLIDNGERFGKGDAIRVRLAITQKYNKEYRAYENNTYRIEAFHEHIQAPSEVKMFDKR